MADVKHLQMLCFLSSAGFTATRYNSITSGYFKRDEAARVDVACVNFYRSDIKNLLKFTKAVLVAKRQESEKMPFPQISYFLLTPLLVCL